MERVRRETSSFDPALRETNEVALKLPNRFRDGKGSKKLSDFAISAVANGLGWFRSERLSDFVLSAVANGAIEAEALENRSGD
jgi:hypothetical protein